MAVDKSSETAVMLSSPERVVTRVALEVYQKSLIRARTKEISGSPVWEFRSREIDFVTSLIGKFS